MRAVSGEMREMVVARTQGLVGSMGGKFGGCDDYGREQNKDETLVALRSISIDSSLETESTGTGCTSYRENEYAWTLGSCSSDWYKRGVGTGANVYEEECCIEPGLQTLTCLDGTGDGWDSPGSSVVIEGETYCDDFNNGASYTVDVIINGKKMNSFMCLNYFLHVF